MDYFPLLTDWGRVTHICVGNLIIIGSDNGLSPDRRQAIIWTNARLLSIEPLRTYFNETLIKTQQFSLKKMHVKLSSAKWRPSCLGLNVLRVRSWNYGMLCMSLCIRMAISCYQGLSAVSDLGHISKLSLNCRLHFEEYVRIQVNTLKPRQMDAISQTSFSSTFSWIKMFEFD